MNLTFLAAADLHLGRASSGAKRDTRSSFSWAPQPVSSTSATAAWYHLVETAINRNVDAVLLAGDLIDRDNHFFEARTALMAGFQHLNEMGIPVIAVAGNHDATVLPEFLRTNPMPNVHLIGLKGKWEEKVLDFSGQKVGFVGWSFPSAHAQFDPTSSIDLPPSLHQRIGLLHCDFGAVQSPYAPVTASSLQRADVSFWVLGHIHKPQKVAEKPLCFYPGSPQSLSAKEQGLHGCVFLDGNTMSIEHIILSSVIYETIEVDVSGVTSLLDAQVRLQSALLKSGYSLQPQIKERVLDLVWTGELENPTLPADWHPEDPGIIDGVYCSIRSVVNQCVTTLPNLNELARGSGPAAVLASAIIDIGLGNETPFVRRLRESATNQLQKLNTQISYGPIRSDGIITPDNHDRLNELMVQECRSLLSSLMLTREQE
jgi:DNA repair exonuclease SbcCD nuclease subunit